MWEDPIVDEIHKIREKILEENNYNLEELFNNIKKNEIALKKDGWKFVTKKDIKRKKANTA